MTMNMKQLRLFIMAVALTAMPHFAAAQAQQTQTAAADLDAKYATELLKPGTPAPDMAVPAIDGKSSVTLADYRGKYVVLDFWASWCPDCRKDAPNVVAMYNKYHEKGVEFLGVSFDTKPESWKKAVETLAIPYPQVGELKNMRESDMAKAYHISWIPTVYVIDPQGNVALATVMSGKVDKLLNSIFPDCAE